MKKIKIAYHQSLVGVGLSRGARRHFCEYVNELSKRDDVELICLGDRVPDPLDPISTIYFREEAKLQWNHSVSYVPAESSFRHRRIAEVLRVAISLYGLVVPEGIRKLARPMVSLLKEKIKSHFGLGGAKVSDLVRKNGKPFSNASIVRPVISLHEIDVLLNFWWLHSPFPNPMSGLYRPPGLRVIGCFLDAIPLRIPHWQPGLISIELFRNLVQTYLENCDEIVANSQSTAADVALFFPHLRKPIYVAPCGVTETDFLPGDRLAVAVSEELLQFVFVGAMEPSKNTLNGLEALARVSQRLGRKVVVTIIGNIDKKRWRQFLSMRPSLLSQIVIEQLGYVSEERKRSLLVQSTALIYVSTWEGFGIPPLEAMAAQVPCVVSDIPPHREFCEDVAEFCDPYDVDSIASAVLRVVEWSPQIRKSRLMGGLVVARSYTWEKAVDKLMNQLKQKPI